MPSIGRHDPTHCAFSIAVRSISPSARRRVAYATFRKEAVNVRILMFGWEFPPRMSGGLGTACYGITSALAGLGHRITFVLPQDPEAGAAPFLDLVSASGIPTAPSEGDDKTEALLGRLTGRPIRSPQFP